MHTAREQNLQNEQTFRAGIKTYFPTAPFSNPTNVVLFDQGKKMSFPRPHHEGT
jgi:hypothetical protein